MTNRVRTVLGVLLGLAAVCCVLLIFKACGAEKHAAKDSLFIRQRMINIKKGV